MYRVQLYQPTASESANYPEQPSLVRSVGGGHHSSCHDHQSVLTPFIASNIPDDFCIVCLVVFHFSLTTSAPTFTAVIPENKTSLPNQ